VGGEMAVSDITGLAKEGEKTEPAKKREDRPLGKSKVNPDLEPAMRGGGGKCVGCNNPQGENKSQGNSQVLTDAVKMDKGMPL
jgi:hypothetical protein